MFDQLFKQVTDLPGFGTGVNYTTYLVNWASGAGCGALMADSAWGSITAHLGYLALLVAAWGLLSTRAFRSYQRSI
jgi:hypothetical protein